MIISGLLIYLFLQVLLCLYLARRVKTESDYLVAGRNFPVIIVAVSLFATWFGAETTIGSSGAVYAEGLSGARVDPFGYGLCLFLAGALIAGKIWKEKYLTLADFYQDRFGPQVALLSVWILALSSLIWAAAQLRAFGQIISATTPLDLELTLLIALSFVLVYTLLGGLMGSMITDVIQAFVIVLGLVGLTIALLGQLPDPIETLRSIPPERWQIRAEGESWWERIDRWAIPILGSLVAQEVIARMFASRTPSIAVRACYWGGGIYVVVGLMPVLAGMIGPSLIEIEGDSEQFLIILAIEKLPYFVVGIFIGAIISALLATIDSILISVAGLIGHNFITPILKVKAEKTKLAVTRWVVLGAGIITYILARRADGIFDLLEMASSFGTAGILVITLLGLWTRLGDQRAALLALITGLVATPLAEYVLEIPSPFLFSIFCALLCFLFFSFLVTAKNLRQIN